MGIKKAKTKEIATVHAAELGVGTGATAARRAHLPPGANQADAVHRRHAQGSRGQAGGEADARRACYEHPGRHGAARGRVEPHVFETLAAASRSPRRLGSQPGRGGRRARTCAPGGRTRRQEARPSASPSSTTCSRTTRRTATPSRCASSSRRPRPIFVLFPHTYQVRDFAPKLATSLGKGVIATHRASLKTAGWCSSASCSRARLNADVVFAGPAPYFASMQAGAYRADQIARGRRPLESRPCRSI